ncbi:polyprenol phosphomannose-dependent alpha 1,6 mannosyltransferase MptB [Flavobacterium sp.]|uniref:polyprenol phosphomannose-dependent alpha 1,6 mannosyltransferase MptB n=1 Tax=Flavobacterium sp. TaxID=239 RepID=UPI003752F7B4
MDAFFTKYQIYIATTISVIAYFILGYFFEREQFYWLLFLYTLAFIGMISLLQTPEYEKTFFKIGLIYRILFLFSTPVLSQDFYRFIWDGNTILSGINPFQYKPDTIINTIASFPNTNYLYDKMGSLSASHYSNYPPINQLLFAISAFIGGKSILVSTMVLRIIIILADIGIYYYGRKILLHFNKNTENIFWYFLNPLVILELTGNLHFEGVMLFFLVVGLYYLLTKKWIIAAVFIALSISVKLLPLLLLPLFLNYLGFKKSVLFYSLIISLNVLFFLPFINPTLINNYVATISLWFTNFEFNASLYYLAREVGFYVKGYNIIHSIGQITPIITILIILFFAFLKKNKSVDTIAVNALLVITLYLFISTTVHPWYVINLILLSVFTKYKFTIVWSFVIILSYYAYSVFPFKENIFLIITEYSIVYLMFIYELRKNNLQEMNNAR